MENGKITRTYLLTLTPEVVMMLEDIRCETGEVASDVVEKAVRKYFIEEYYKDKALRKYGKQVGKTVITSGEDD